MKNNPKQSDIYMVEFGPGKGREYKKVRPAIILMTDNVIHRARILTCVPLTKKSDNYIEDDIIVEKDNYNNLIYDSIIKMHHITACDRSRILKYVGYLSENDWKNVKKRLKQIFGI